MSRECDKPSESGNPKPGVDWCSEAVLNLFPGPPPPKDNERSDQAKYGEPLKPESKGSRPIYETNRNGQPTKMQPLEVSETEFKNAVCGMDVHASINDLRNCSDKADLAQKNDPALYAKAKEMADALRKFVDGGLKDSDKLAVQKLMDKSKEMKPEDVSNLLDIVNGVLIQQMPNDKGKVLYLDGGKFTADLKMQEFELRLASPKDIADPNRKHIRPEFVENKKGERISFTVDNGGLGELFRKAIPPPQPKPDNDPPPVLASKKDFKDCLAYGGNDPTLLQAPKDADAPKNSDGQKLKDSASKVADEIMKKPKDRTYKNVDHQGEQIAKAVELALNMNPNTSVEDLAEKINERLVQKYGEQYSETVKAYGSGDKRQMTVHPRIGGYALNVNRAANGLWVVKVDGLLR